MYPLYFNKPDMAVPPYMPRLLKPQVFSLNCVDILEVAGHPIHHQYSTLVGPNQDATAVWLSIFIEC